MDRRAVSEDNILLDPVQRFAGAGMPPYGSEQVLDFVQARAAASGEDSDLVARGRNGPPVARDDTNGGDAVIEAGRGVPGDAVAKGNVLSNDSDPDFDPLTVSKTGKFHGEFGTLSLSARGQWVYHLDNSDPDTDALAKGEKVVDAFKYTVNDSFVGSDTATLRISITGSDDEPRASIKLNKVTRDNIVNAREAGTDVRITGKVGGDVDDGDIVTLEVNGKNFKGAVKHGHFSIAVPGSQLAADDDLKIKASVTASDNAGHSATAHASKGYGVDVTPPKATISVDPVTADNIINSAEADGKITVTGTVGGDVGNGDTVTLVVGGHTYRGTVSGGHFSIDVANSALLADGDQTVKASVTVTGKAGNTTTATDTHAYQSDITPPKATIKLDAVTADNVVNAAEGADQTVAVTGTVGQDVKDGDTVTVVVNGHSYTGKVASGAFSIKVDGADLVADADKAVKASVTTTDNAGNTTTATDTHDYGVDRTPPDATIALGPVTADNTINIAEGSSTVAITGTVGGDAKNGDTVTLVVNGHTYTGPACGGTFSIDVSGSDLRDDSDKTIDASVTTTDSAGNTTTVSDAQHYSIDTTAPTATITLDAVTADGIVNAAEGASTVAVTGTVGGEAKDGDSVTIVVNGHSYTGTVASDTFSIDVDGSDLLADGDTAIQATVTTADGAGNETTATANPQTYTIDTTPPTATITLGTATADNIVNKAEGDTTAVAITGTVGGDVRNGDTVTLIVNNHTYTGTVSAGQFSIDVTGADLLADADTTIQASVTTADDAGNTATATGTKAYNVDITPPAATVTLDAVTVDNTVNTAEGAASVVAITGTVGGDVRDGDTVTIIVNGNSYTGVVSSNTFSIDVTGADLLADSDNTIQASVTIADSVGNTTTAADTQAYGIDTTPPSATITLSAITANNIVERSESGGTVNITGSVTGEAKDGDVVTVVVNGETYTGLVQSGAFVIAIAGSDLLADADKSIHASVAVSDAAGNTGSASDSHSYAINLDLSLTSLAASQGFIIVGEAVYDVAGHSVSSAGDINGDGLDDLIVGAVNSIRGAGEAYVVFGTTSGFGTTIDGRQVLDLTTLSTTQGFRILGDAAQYSTGYSVSGGGDVNGDGFDDLIVSAPFGGNGGEPGGQTYVVYGGAFTGDDPITRTGSTAGEMLIGGLGSDTLTGGGGADIISGGAGWDVIGVTGTSFARIDGGTGKDTLRIDGASDMFDFATIRDSAIDSIERIDMRAAGAQRVSLDKHDVFHLSDDKFEGETTLTIHGNAADTVSTTDTGWTQVAGDDVVRIFENGHATLVVDSDIALGGTLI